eukprot:gene11190-11340_t
MAISADAATLHAGAIDQQHPDGGLAQLFLAADGVIERRRAENIFKQLDERSLTEEEQRIIQQRVEWQRTLLWEYEKREHKRKVKELQDLWPELSDAAAARALELCHGKEDDAVLRLTEEAAFRRRLMAETSSSTAAASTAKPQGSSSHSRSCSSNVGRNRNDQPGSSCARHLKPSQVTGNVFVGRFRSKLGPLQERAIADAAYKAAAQAAAAEGQPMPKRRGRPRKQRPPQDPPSVAGTTATARRVIAPQTARPPAAGTRATKGPVAEAAAQPPDPAAHMNFQGAASIDHPTVISNAAFAAAVAGGSFVWQRSSSPSAAADSDAGDESDTGTVSDAGQSKAAAAGTGMPPSVGAARATSSIRVADDDDEDDEDDEAAEEMEGGDVDEDDAPAALTARSASPPLEAVASLADTANASAAATTTTAAIATDGDETDGCGALQQDPKQHGQHHHGRHPTADGQQAAAQRVASMMARQVARLAPLVAAGRLLDFEIRRPGASAAVLELLAAEYGTQVAASRSSRGAKRPSRAISQTGHTCRGRVRQKSHKTTELVELGQLVDRPQWYNAGYIFPAGFKSKLLFRSSVDIDALTLHECEIIGEGGQYWPAPTFVVTARDHEDQPIIAKSCTGCWSGILKRINATIAKRIEEGENLPPPPRTAIAGPEYFGLNDLSTIAAIETLDPQHLCTTYWIGKEQREAAAAGMPVPTQPLPGRVGDLMLSGANATNGAGGSSSSSTTGRKRGRARAADRQQGGNDAEDEGSGYRGAHWSSISRRERYIKRCTEAGGEAPVVEGQELLPGVLDPITLEPVVNPAISPAGHLMGLATWKAVLAENPRCPFTKAPLRPDMLTVLTTHNIERHRHRIIAAK